MEGDRIADTSFIISDYFNPLPPHGGRLCTLYMTTADNYFNPLPPHGGRPSVRVCISCSDGISIHSLRMEGDNTVPAEGKVRDSFQSTPSAWRETGTTAPYTSENSFQSTPSAWRETCFSSLKTTKAGDFNPLPPHGGRLSLFSKHFTNVHNFNPLPPHGGRPPIFSPNFSPSGISIHSLRMEGDFVICYQSLSYLLFQSTPSAWRETFRQGGKRK